MTEHNATPLVSIIMPAYNQAEYIAEAIYSVTGQTYGNLELLIVDDGSPDNVVETVERYAAKDSRIRFFHTENNRVSAARYFTVAC